MATSHTTSNPPQDYSRAELKAIFSSTVMTEGKERLAHTLTVAYGDGFMRELLEEIWADAAGLSLAEYQAREAKRRAAIDAMCAVETAAHAVRVQTTPSPRPLRTLALRLAPVLANLL